MGADDPEKRVPDDVIKALVQTPLERDIGEKR